MNKKGKIIKILSQLNGEVRQKYKAEIKGVFGSYVRGEEQKKSDLDVLVNFLEGASLFDLVGLANYLEKKIKVKVDVVPIDSIRREIKDDILKEAIYL